MKFSDYPQSKPINNLFDSERGSLNALSLIITSGNWNTAAASTTPSTVLLVLLPSTANATASTPTTAAAAAAATTTTRVIKRMSEIRLKGVEIIIV